MRYGPIADDARDRWFLDSPRAPLALLATFVPLVQARGLMAAVRAGVFEALRNGPRAPEVIAEATGSDLDTLELLLRVLAASGYLDLGPDGYRLSQVASSTLLVDGTDSLTAWVALSQTWWRMFDHFDETLRCGSGHDLHTNLGAAEDWATYQEAMLENARRTAPAVAELVPVRVGATALLDVGGSHGLFGASVARLHPPMRCTVLDLPAAIDHAERLARREGIADVVSHRGADVLIDDLGSGYDVVFLGNLLHHFAPGQVQALLARVRCALTPDGTVAVYGTSRAESGAVADLLGDSFALFFRLTSSARTYTIAEIEGWMAEAGFSSIRTEPLPLGAALTVARSE
ncbi:methyltransferase [Nocardia colli]|uniref:methyltransferase n=1 Tax=Nocardia colli TaxID=2545717 RepID=UPI0035E36611